MNKWMMGIIFSCVLMCSNSLALAQQDSGVTATSVEDRIAAEEQKIETELGLSAEQQQKIQDYRKTFRDQQKELVEALQTKRVALQEELDNDGSVDRGKVDALVADIKSLQGKMLDNRIAQGFKVREVLTPDQYKKLKEMRKQRQVENSMRFKAKERIWEKKAP